MDRAHAHDKLDLLSTHQEWSDISAEGSCLTEETKGFTAAFLLIVLRPGGPEWRDWEEGHFKQSLSRCGNNMG